MNGSASATLARQPSAAVAFGAFAAAYFLSALLRAVTATLAPQFSAELKLQAADLGLLAGAYFLGFAAMQLPLGQWLDRIGPRRTLLALLSLAVLGCAAFAQAQGLWTLFAGRMLIGVGVSACLMAPLTCFRRLFAPQWQMRVNSWMLMTGSLGMVASTLPVQALLPVTGWRGLFWVLAVLLAAAMALVALGVPQDPAVAGTAVGARNRPAAGWLDGYGTIMRHPLFVRSVPIGFFLYGGLVAVQALWAGPWMTRVSGLSPAAAAQGLFAINLSMLVTFMAWGVVLPRLAARGIEPRQLLRWGLPLPVVVMAVIVGLGSSAGAAHWALWCVTCSVVSISQPAVGAAFPAALVGRALSAFNLVIFLGVFGIQWGIGLAIDALQAAGWGEQTAFRVAFAGFGACALLSYLWFALAPQPAGDNSVASR